MNEFISNKEKNFIIGFSTKSRAIDRASHGKESSAMKYFNDFRSTSDFQNWLKNNCEIVLQKFGIKTKRDLSKIQLKTHPDRVIDEYWVLGKDEKVSVAELNKMARLGTEIFVASGYEKPKSTDGYVLYVAADKPAPLVSIIKECFQKNDSGKSQSSKAKKLLGNAEAAETLTSINLNQEQLELIDKYFEKDSERVILTSPELTIKSLQTLKPEGWLDDAVIMSYLSILQQQHPKEDAAIWDSQWITKIDQLDNYLSKQKDKLRGTVFFPLNNGRHWYFAKIDNGSSIITIYNSLKTCIIDDEEDTLRKFANKLRAALASNKKKGQKKVLGSDFRVVNDESYPRQTDSFNCGVYTLMGIDALWLGDGVDADRFKENVNQVRNVIAYTLIKEAEGEDDPIDLS